MGHLDCDIAAIASNEPANAIKASISQRLHRSLSRDTSSFLATA
jgi:hypothetical protein